MTSLRAGAAILIALTGSTVFAVVMIGSHRTTGLLSPGLWVALVLLTAFAKVAAIGYWFMELRSAPKALRYLFFGWCVAFATAVVAVAGT
jgi:hypothetical protein